MTATLIYGYDAAGRRTRVGGSLARLGLAQGLSSTNYNDGNRQTGFGAATLTYDNGNLTSDGTNTYTWNVRGQLTAISGPGLSASFSYDAVGRRTSKTVNGSTTTTAIATTRPLYNDLFLKTLWPRREVKISTHMSIIAL